MLQAQTHPLLTYQSNVNRERLEAAYPRIEALFRQFLEKSRVPGLAYGIVIDNDLVQTGSMGVQNVESGAPVTPDSVFRIASMTKSFTAMSLIKLRDEGKLRFDDPAATYVPELASIPYPTRDSAPITVRQLLTMGAGLPQDDPWGDRQLAASEDQLSTWLAQGISFSTAPGTQYEYSNLGYAILGRIVTNVAGMRYQDYAKAQILDPLGMISSTYDIEVVDPARLAMGYRWQDERWVAEEPLADGAFASMGGLFTTINDFAHYMSYLLSAFPPRDDAESGPVRRSSLREMQQAARIRLVGSSRATPDAPAFVQAEGYGYGLSAGIDSLNGYSVAHGGGLPGYGSFYRLLPDVGIGVAAFSNLTYSGIGGQMNEILAALHETGGVKPRSISTTPALAAAQRAISDLYEQWSNDNITTLATESFFLDMALERRRAQVETLRAEFGKCTWVTPIEPENALRGRWIMDCESGRLEVYTTLAPTVPPRVQTLDFTTAKPLSADLKKTFKQVVKLIRQWDADDASGLFAHSLKSAAIERQLDAVHVQYGALKFGDVLEGDGETQARVRLNGDRGNVDLTIVVSPKSGKIHKFTFSRPHETVFVP